MVSALLLSELPDTVLPYAARLGHLEHAVGLQESDWRRATPTRLSCSD